MVTTIPTIGFNVESVTYKNLNFNVWDLGGQTSIRPYWRCYYANTAAVIFVVDSTDIERLQTAADELAAMLNEDELKDAALLVFANKQDQPGAKGAGDISQALRLGELRDRNWSIMACSAVEGSGVTEGMDWLVVRPCPLPYLCSLTYVRFPSRRGTNKGHSKRYHKTERRLHHGRDCLYIFRKPDMVGYDSECVRLPRRLQWARRRMDRMDGISCQRRGFASTEKAGSAFSAHIIALHPLIQRPWLGATFHSCLPSFWLSMRSCLVRH